MTEFINTSPCKKCGETLRYKKSRDCVLCSRKRSKNHQKQNPDKVEKYDLIKKKKRDKRESDGLLRWPMTKERSLFKNARNRARKLGLEFNITENDIIIPKICPVLGIPIIPAKGRMSFSNNSPTLDRTDNTKGYIKGNIQVISWRANRLKSDSSLEELKSIVKWLENLKNGD